MAKKKATGSRTRMTKLQKFFIEHNLDVSAKNLAIELGIPEDAIQRYMDKIVRSVKQADEEEKAGKPRTVDDFMIKNKEYGVVIMSKEASQMGDASRGAGLKSPYYRNVIHKIREEK